MRAHHHFVAVLSLAALGLPGIGRAQTRIEDTRTAYGSRVGDRGNDPKEKTMIGLNNDRRVNQRVDARINSRIDTRLDRFVTPQTDYQSSYTPQIDDGTKKPVSRITTPDADDQQAYTPEIDDAPKKR